MQGDDRFAEDFKKKLKNKETMKRDQIKI